VSIKTKRYFSSLLIFLIFALVLSSCSAAKAAGFDIPGIQKGKYNVAMVLIGPHNDNGWSQSHYEGLQYIAANIPNVNVAYVENVPEGSAAESVFRALSRKGFNLILGTSFGYMDYMQTVAAEFPDIVFIHLSGNKSNRANFGNLMGAMESMKYLAGMLGGARAKMDGNPKLGYIATFPVPEELRLGNAFALGMRKTCPECTLDVYWIKTWHDPTLEQNAANALFDRGAQVVFTGADTPAVADVAAARGKWGITYDWVGSCKSDRCLTAPYWNWGPIYAQIVQGLIDKTYKPGWDYFDADSGSLGLYGFMEGQSPRPGAAELPAEVLAQVRNVLASMRKGTFTRFDIFSGPINDSQGKVVIPADQKMTQLDLDQFPGDGLGCKYCMKWWAAGIIAPLP
jgi:basic membrane protein A and related proteins